jgi:exodeoxyribonuclease V alpha subunit
MAELTFLTLPSELQFEVPPALQHLREEGFLESIDLQFVGFLMRQGVTSETVLWGAALASHAVRQGNICLDLNEVAGLPVQSEGDTYTLDEKLLICPALSPWRTALYDTFVCGPPGSAKPLILDKNDRLYLFRYWQYENLLAERLLGFLDEQTELGFTPVALRERLDALFPQGDDRTLNWQRVAAITALMHPFCVISGGPGTGKTTTVLSILLLLLEQHEQRNPGGRKLQIALAAPTGKAAARLNESIVQQKNKRIKATEDEALKARITSIPEEVRTLHRLLGTRANSPYFRHHQDNPLPYDVVIVDEASMVDLPMMTKLVNALAPHARFLLLGDKDQLASVEAGAVLGDLCSEESRAGYSKRFASMVEQLAAFGHRLPALPEAVETSRPAHLQDNIVLLRRSYRFDSESGIGRLASLVNDGKGADALTFLQGQPMQSDVYWRKLPRQEHLFATLRPVVLEGYQRYLQHLHEPEEAFQAFESFRLLCAHRTGIYGVQALNQLVEQILRAQGLLEDTGQRWYRGRPVMIQRNDYNLKLFNGDIGLLLPDPRRQGALSAFFPTSEGGMRAILPARLPEHETVYAMTVHKSQGSEFDRVLVILPEKISPILTRELVYTGLTRARSQVGLWGTEGVFLQALKKRVLRSSGLQERLWAK